MAEKYIAVLGYGANCSEANSHLAFQAGHEIAAHGYTVCAGNLGGTFEQAYKGAKSIAGATIAVLERANTAPTPLCDEVVYAADTVEKHRLIADMAAGAIVIGGGPGTTKLIAKLLDMNRIVVALRNSGGVADRNLDQRIAMQTDVATAIDYISGHTARRRID